MNEMFITYIGLFFSKIGEKKEPMNKSCVDDYCALFFIHASFRQIELKFQKILWSILSFFSIILW